MLMKRNGRLRVSPDAYRFTTHEERSAIATAAMRKVEQLKLDPNSTAIFDGLNNLMLVVSLAGVRGTGIGCYFDDAAHELRGLGGDEFQDLYHFTVGGPVDDPRLTTRSAYAHLGRPSPIAESLFEQPVT
jgi:hypothetical protein